MRYVANTGYQTPSFGYKRTRLTRCSALSVAWCVTHDDTGTSDLPPGSDSSRGLALVGTFAALVCRLVPLWRGRKLDRRRSGAIVTLMISQLAMCSCAAIPMSCGCLVDGKASGSTFHGETMFTMHLYGPSTSFPSPLVSCVVIIETKGDSCFTQRVHLQYYNLLESFVVPRHLRTNVLDCSYWKCWPLPWLKSCTMVPLTTLLTISLVMMMMTQRYIISNMDGDNSNYTCRLSQNGF